MLRRFTSSIPLRTLQLRLLSPIFSGSPQTSAFSDSEDENRLKHIFKSFEATEAQLVP